MIVELPALTLLGAVLALDGTAVGQFMVSRPLVAGWLAGWILGDPIHGLMVGALLELFLISAFPVGGAQFPEGGPAAVVGVAGAAGVPGPGGLALGVLLGVLVSQAAGASIWVLRRINGRLAPDPSRKDLTEGRVAWAHLSAIGLDFLRGAALTALGVVVGEELGRWVREAWPLQGPSTRGLLLAGASVPVGILLAAFGGWRRRGGLFLGGLLGAVILGVLL